MIKISIDQEKCKSCLLCINFCPKGCIEVSMKLNSRGTNPVKFKENAGCTGCAMCAVICPDCCIEIVKIV